MRRVYIAFVLLGVSFGNSSLHGIGLQDNFLLKDDMQQQEVTSYGSLKAGAYRDIYYIPPEYGRLIEILPSDRGSIQLWFEDGQGNLRDILLKDSGKPFIIKRQGTLTVKQ